MTRVGIDGFAARGAGGAAGRDPMLGVGAPPALTATPMARA
jgi:hypothetical protein